MSQIITLKFDMVVGDYQVRHRKLWNIQSKLPDKNNCILIPYPVQEIYFYMFSSLNNMGGPSLLKCQIWIDKEVEISYLWLYTKTPGVYRLWHPEVIQSPQGSLSHVERSTWWYCPEKMDTKLCAFFVHFFFILSRTVVSEGRMKTFSIIEYLYRASRGFCA